MILMPIPQFKTQDEADAWMRDREMVLTVQAQRRAGDLVWWLAEDDSFVAYGRVGVDGWFYTALYHRGGEQEPYFVTRRRLRRAAKVAATREFAKRSPKWRARNADYLKRLSSSKTAVQDVHNMAR